MRHFRIVNRLLAVVILSGVLFVIGCGKGAGAPSETRNVLGTKVTITVHDPGRKPADLKPLFDEAFSLMMEWESKVLTPGADNAVAALSQGAGAQSIPTEPDVFELLMQGIRMYDASGKVFDIRYGPFLDLWKFDATPRVPTPAELDTAKGLVVEGGMFVAGNSILLAKKGMRFDVRDMAPGYIFDLVAAKLAAKGIRTAVISSPRLVRAMGDPPDKRGFKVSFPHPLKPETAWATAFVSVGGTAYFSVSDGRFQSGGKWYHRILDPRTGMPAGKCTGVLVQTPDAATAQALAYATFVLGGTDEIAAEGKTIIGGSVVVREEGGRLTETKSGSLAANFEAAH